MLSAKQAVTRDASVIVMAVLILFALGWVIAAIDKHWFPRDVEPEPAHFQLA